MIRNKIVIVGDIMIDNNVYCECSRIAPEAPLPIYKELHKNYNLGGCGNLAVNLKKLYSNVFVVTVVGNDYWGKKTSDLLLDNDIENLCITSDDRKTTLKTRQFVGNTLVNRLDSEHTHDISTEHEKQILNVLNNNKLNIHSIVLSDYEKGVITTNLAINIIKFANENNILTYVDPKIKQCIKYKNCTVIKPNKTEALQLVQHTSAQLDFINSTKKLSEMFNCKHVVITLSQNGILHYDVMKNKLTHYSKKYIQSSQVTDVSGAGDMAISILIYYNSIKNNIEMGCETANKLCQIAVTKPGICKIDNTLDKRIYTERNFHQLANTLKNKNVVFTCGCFDIVHLGHISYLKQAKQLGDTLIVGLNTDKSVKKIKGQTRPINEEMYRANFLLELDCVDYVILFNDDTPIEIIKQLQPLYLVKGGDYDINETNPQSKKYIVGKEHAKNVKTINFIDSISTSNIILNIIKSTNENTN